MPSFSAIKPAPDRDNFTFDFTKEIGASGALTSPVVWNCTVSKNSSLIDPTPAARIIGPPTFDTYTTKSLCGDMIDGVIYTLSVNGNIDDGRIITLTGDVTCTSTGPTDPVMTPDQFRQLYPAFSDPKIYTDEQIAFWINQATVNPPIDPYRWGQFYNLGIMLWIAHNLMYQAYAAKLAKTGTMGTGIASSKSVNGVSLSYDLGFGSEMDAGWYGTTPYGNEFLYYARLAGMGPIQF
jgi:hypothetical protein